MEKINNNAIIQRELSIWESSSNGFTREIFWKPQQFFPVFAPAVGPFSGHDRENNCFGRQWMLTVIKRWEDQIEKQKVIVYVLKTPKGGSIDEFTNDILNFHDFTKDGWIAGFKILSILHESLILKNICPFSRITNDCQKTSIHELTNETMPT